MRATFRGLRAIAWLRWRLLTNSLIGGRKRDEIEQFSRVIARIVPFMILALSASTFLAVCALGYIGGRMMASGLVAAGAGLLVVRLLTGLMIFTIIALSLISPTQSTLSRYTRLLLLPIPRRALHLVEVLASLGDPWVAVVMAGLSTFAIGLYAGGRSGVALVAALAAILTVATVVCLGALVSLLVAWLMRDRRRGELFTVVFVIGFSLMAFVPAFMERSRQTRNKETQMTSGRAARPGIDVGEFDRNLPAWTKYLPSELHGRTVGAAFVGDRAAATTALTLLLVEAVLLFLASGRVHRQILGSLEGDRGRRRNTAIRMTTFRFPGLSAGSSAVAVALVRNAFRSVRGRLTLLLPGPMLGVLVLAFKGVPSETWAVDAASRGYLLFGAGLIFTFYALHSISMNLFASDRAGLTLQFLVPVTDRELVRGKLVGFATVMGTGGLSCFLIAMLIARSGSPAYWLTVIFGGVATFCLIAPLAIWMSALFPVANDLSKTGSAGNPHPLAMVAGTFATAVLSIPTVAILAVAEFMFKSPITAVGMASGWLVVAAAIGFPLVKLAARAVSSRRENLALVAQGR